MIFRLRKPKEDPNWT